MNRIESIIENLNELRDLDKRFSIFGSSRHQYKLNNTLSKEEISKIEKDNEIVLSEDYRTILEFLGNGEAGCGYGLEKLSLNRINPPYVGTDKLLRNWEDPENIECDMVEIDEISGYIKLFDYGCGMEYGLIVNGEEKGALIFFDCDGRFEKLENNSLLEIYERWLGSSLNSLKEIKKKLIKNTVDEVVTDEWENENFSIREMIYSIMNIDTPIPKPHTDEYKEIMREARIKWLTTIEENSKNRK